MMNYKAYQVFVFWLSENIFFAFSNFPWFKQFDNLNNQSTAIQITGLLLSLVMQEMGIFSQNLRWETRNHWWWSWWQYLNLITLLFEMAILLICYAIRTPMHLAIRTTMHSWLANLLFTCLLCSLEFNGEAMAIPARNIMNFIPLQQLLPQCDVFQDL